jgi:hypothetical protein
VDAGDSAMLPADTADLDADTDTSEPHPLDLAGKKRVEGQSVDMGAYEFNGNRAPVITHAGGVEEAVLSMDEGQASVATVVATDPDGDALTYSLGGGADDDLFSIDPATGALAFKTAPDFETPTDTEKDGTYLVRIKATDSGAGTLTDEQALYVTINNINEAPAITSHSGAAHVAINLEEGTAAVTTITATDPDGDTLALTLSAGADKSLFGIDSMGQLTFNQPPSYASPADADGNNLYQVTVQAADAALTALQVLTITVTQSSTGDSDADGLPDSWETHHGLSTGIDDSADDPDGDRLTNLQEYQLGTDPKDGNSSFRTQGLQGNGGGKFTVSWNSISGKSYTIQSSTDFSSWTELSGPHVATAATTSAELSVDISLKRSFFRIVLDE